jgi:hypothetical protein
MSTLRHAIHAAPIRQDNPAIAVILAQSTYQRAASHRVVVHRHGSGRHGIRVNAAYAACVHDALRRIV